MKRLIRLLARLYPAPWRRRYGDEFAAFLDDLRLTWRDVLDVLHGAIKIQLTTWEPGRTLALLAIAGALVAAAISFSLPGPYVSSGVLRLRGGGNDALRAAQQVMSRQSLSALIQQEDLYPRQRRNRPMEDVVEGMRRDIRLALFPHRLVVQFSYPDAAAAQRVNRRLIEGLMDAQLPARQATALELLDPPSLPGRPFPGTHSVYIATGFGVGLLLGAVAALVQRQGTRRSLAVAGCGLAGMVLAAALSYLIEDSLYVLDGSAL